MRKALIIALVVVMLVTGIPIMVGGMAGACHDCGVAMMTMSGCAVGILIVFSLFVAMVVAFIRPRSFIGELQLVYSGLDRPPRLI